MDMQMHTLRTSVDGDGVMTVTFDAQGKSVNTITWQILQDLTAVADAVERDKPKGVIFHSAKPDCFIAGGDLFEMRKMSSDAELMTRFLTDGQALWNRIEKLPVPTVAAINGDCLGGGYELALACTYRVAADDGSINIGLPEVRIGILPGWGGTTRMPRLLGLRKALPLLLAGKTMPPKKAKKAGLIDETVRREALLAAAKRLVLSGKPPSRKLPLIDRLTTTRPLRNIILKKATARTLEQTQGNYPAAMQVLKIVRAGYDGGFAAGLAAERDSLRVLIDDPACHNLMRLFFLKQGAKRAVAEQLRGAKPAEVKQAAVIGGGTMGAGIAHSLVRAGVHVRLVEVNEKAAAAALGRVRKMLDDDVYSGRLSALEAKHAFARVSPASDWTGLNLADVVVEAVAESMDVKREVFAKLDRLCRPDAVLASNTSSLSVTEMARATTRPGRVVGLHFFNPVPKMPLVEVVRAEQSEDGPLATAVALSSRIGKVPVLVKDAPGFLVNRVLIPYLSEAQVMASEGVPFTAVDEAMKKWGMPMGPFELLDEIGLDIGAHVLKSLGDRMDPPLAESPAMAKVLERGWLGKKSGKGYYIHGGKRKSAKPAVNLEMESLLAAGRVAPAMTEEQIQWRLVLPMVNEAARLLAEGVTDSADTVDLATVLGTGFAPFRGGLAKFADSVGMDKILVRLEELAARHGARFAPAAALKPLAAGRRPMSAIQAKDSAPAASQRPAWRDQGAAAAGHPVARSPHAQ
jgi:3-hydroxyacyl-CoA dehydrogenase/enoyl-CoA hydratase/3-hydroxybutyryl-CoA epimerase